MKCLICDDERHALRSRGHVDLKLQNGQWLSHPASSSPLPSQSTCKSSHWSPAKFTVTLTSIGLREFRLPISRSAMITQQYCQRMVYSNGYANAHNGEEWYVAFQSLESKLTSYTPPIRFISVSASTLNRVLFSNLYLKIHTTILSSRPNYSNAPAKGFFTKFMIKLLSIEYVLQGFSVNFLSDLFMNHHYYLICSDRLNKYIWNESYNVLQW